MRAYSLLIGARNARGRFTARDDGILRATTARHFPGGFTIVEARGAWYDGARGRFRREETRQVLVCASAAAKPVKWARELGRALRQQEVLLIALGSVRRLRLAFSTR